MSTKNKIFTNVNWLLTLIVTFVIIFMIRDCRGNKVTPAPEKVYSYKTDTIYLDQDYKEKYEKLVKEVEEKGVTTPVKEVIIYKDNFIPVIIEVEADHLLVKIDSLENAIQISNQYIAKYSQADKLVTMGLTLDKLDITTLDINGQVSEKQYPLYLYDFDYKWADNKLNHIPHKRKPPINNRFNQLYFKPGYEFVRENPYIGLEYDIILGRFKLGADTNLFFRPSDNLDFKVKVGYRLF